MVGDYTVFFLFNMLILPQVIKNFLLSKCWEYWYYLFFAGLGKDHEILRRRIENGAKELWFFLQSELKKLKNLEGNVLQRHADEFLSDLGHHERCYSFFTFHLAFGKDYNLRI